jgi:hypothetical protein
MISSFTDRFAVRSASPVRSLRCEIGFACEIDFVANGGAC